MSKVNIDGISETPVAECTATVVADALTRSFEGYVMPVNVSAQGYERRFRPENLDPFASRVYFREATPVAVLLVARRGWISRIAAMAVEPEVRRRGVGKQVMRGAIQDAVSRGDRSILLEVIEQNTPAVELYTGLGFSPFRRLVGYQHGPGGAAPNKADTLSEFDPLEFARVAAREGEPGLPWMLTPETLSGMVSPARAYHLDHHAYAMIGDPETEVVTLTALVVPRVHRRKGWGNRIMQALYAAFAEQSWAIPATVPEDLAPAFFRRCGWGLQGTSQLEMGLELSQRLEGGTNA